jgi:hypothetical protein
MSQQNVDVIRALLPDPATDVAWMFRDLGDTGRAAAAMEEVGPLFDAAGAGDVP